MVTEKISSLLDQYFDFAFEEGREGRFYDTEAGDAQRVRSELEAALSTDAEPVAWMWSDTSNGQGYDTKFAEYPPTPSPYISGEIIPLYDTPPAPSVAVKVSDEQIAAFISESLIVSGPTKIRAGLEAALSAQVQDVAGTVEVFDRDHPELYWSVAKGKITEGEPLYGAMIMDLLGREMSHGESDKSAGDAFNIAVANANLAAAPAAKLEEKP